MPLQTTPDKARKQIERRNPEGAKQYRAELRYFHVPQRAILGMTNAYQVLDETYIWGQPSGDEAAERFQRAFLDGADNRRSDYYQGTRPVPQVPGASAYEEG